MSQWSFQPILNSYLAVAAVAGILAALLLLRPRFGNVTNRRLAWLIGCRVVVILLLIIAMLRPTHVSTSSQPQSAVLILLLDRSRSMQLPAGFDELSRWEAQAKTIEDVQAILANMPERMEVKIYAYDTELHAIEFEDGTVRLPEAADGDQTDIGTALADAVDGELGKRLAGVVLLGDGVQTAFHPRVEMQQAARQLDRRGAPLFTVAFGPVGDLVQSRDVAIENLQDQYTVFVKNELALRGILRVRGFVNQSIPVELLVQKPDGSTETIGPLSLVAREDGQAVPVEMSYIPPEPGRYKLTMRAAEQTGELVTKNNELSAYLRVLEGGLRVLYIEGQLRMEQKFLRRSLDASPDIEVDFLWVDSRLRDRWPLDLTKQFTGETYDVVILGDLDSTALGDASLQALASAIDRGTGLAMLGGYHSFGPGGYRETPLGDVLPIEIDRFERQDFDAAIRGDLHLDGPIKVQPVRPHPVVQLAGGNANQTAWERLPELGGANKFAGVKDGVGVRIVAESSRGEPLVVTGQYGNGRVLAVAVDSTWQWWMQGHQTAHQRFWRQCVLWLAQRDDTDDDEVWVKLDQRRFNPGTRVEFTAGARDATRSPIPDASLSATLASPDGTQTEIRLTRDGDHWRGAVEETTAPGDYVITITASRSEQQIGNARGEFLVYDQDVELSNPATNHGQLARLAAATKDAGGRLIAPEQLPALLTELRDQPPDMEIEVQTKWQLGDTAFDGWLFFLAFTTLLGTEWFFRKKWGLV